MARLPLHYVYMHICLTCHLYTLTDAQENINHVVRALVAIDETDIKPCFDLFAGEDEMIDAEAPACGVAVPGTVWQYVAPFVRPETVANLMHMLHNPICAMTCAAFAKQFEASS